MPVHLFFDGRAASAFSREDAELGQMEPQLAAGLAIAPSDKIILNTREAAVLVQHDTLRRAFGQGDEYIVRENNGYCFQRHPGYWFSPTKAIPGKTAGYHPC